MRRLITRAIMLVAIVTVVVLGVPLAYVAHRSIDNDAVVHLQRRAALAIGEVTLPLDPNTITKALSEPDDPPDVTVYDLTGARLTGPGPSTADAAVRRALRGQPAALHLGTDLVVATPLNDRSTEQVVGAVRVTTPEATLWARTLTAWAVMAAAAALALVIAWVTARRHSRRLTVPIEALVNTSRLVRDGQLPAPPEPTGIGEIDAVAASLHETSTEVAHALARERAFTRDVSHQLRTPLTRLRLVLDTLDGHPDARAAVAELDHIETTIAHLVAVRRASRTAPDPIDLNELASTVARRWVGVAHTLHRAVGVELCAGPARAHATPGAVAQVIDVLIDNALRHGHGTVALRTRTTPGGVAIEVTDRGALPAAELDHIALPDDTEHGIGLRLARALIEADGGRLSIVEQQPSTLQVLYPAAVADEQAAATDRP